MLLAVSAEQPRSSWAQEGAAVIVNFAEHREAAETVVEHIRRGGGQAIAVQANVTDRSEVLAMVEQGLRQFSRIDVLVNNAGIFRSGTVQNLTETSIDEAIASIVRRCAQKISGTHLKSGGSLR